MTELLALPAWNAPPRSLEDWKAQLAAVSRHEPVIARDDDGDVWLELSPLRLRGFIQLEGDHVEAINFELADPDPAPATRVIEDAARLLGWEVHPEDEFEDQSEF